MKNNKYEIYPGALAKLLHLQGQQNENSYRVVDKNGNHIEDLSEILAILVESVKHLNDKLENQKK